MDADEARGVLELGGERGDRQVEVLEAKIASSRITAWILAIVSALTLRSSNTASMTRSQSFSAA